MLIVKVFIEKQTGIYFELKFTEKAAVEARSMCAFLKNMNCKMIDLTQRKSF